MFSLGWPKCRAAARPRRELGSSFAPLQQRSFPGGLKQRHEEERAVFFAGLSKAKSSRARAQEGQQSIAARQTTALVAGAWKYGSLRFRYGVSVESRVVKADAKEEENGR